MSLPHRVGQAALVVGLVAAAVLLGVLSFRWTSARSGPPSALTRLAGPGGPPPVAPSSPPEAVQRLMQEPPPPIWILFDAPQLPELGREVPVTVVVQPDPMKWPYRETGLQGRIEARLNLPAGIGMRGGVWRPMEIPPEEMPPPETGDWASFEYVQLISIPPGEPPETVVRIPAGIVVAEEGYNWIITVRVRLIQGTDPWNGANGVEATSTLFATHQDGVAAFHAKPVRFPADLKEEAPPPLPPQEPKDAQAN